MTLKQACSRKSFPQAPGAFKDLMTHVLQFALRIAFRCVLHRRKSQDIRCQKLFSVEYLGGGRSVYNVLNCLVHPLNPLIAVVVRVFRRRSTGVLLDLVEL